MVRFRSDQRSFPSGKVWSGRILSVLRALGAHFSLIRGYFGHRWSDQSYIRPARSDQRSVPDDTSTWEFAYNFYFNTSNVSNKTRKLSRAEHKDNCFPRENKLSKILKNYYKKFNRVLFTNLFIHSDIKNCPPQ